MHFVHPEIDEPLRRELIAQGVITEAALEGILAMVKIETGDLFADAILPHANDFSADKWIYWLVRRYRMHRLANPVVTSEFISDQGFPKAQCRLFRRWQLYPIARQGCSNAYVWAAGRPDGLKEMAAQLGSTPTLLAAAPQELVAIFKLYELFS